MDEIKKLSEKEFRDIASKYKYTQQLLLKDYNLTLILFLLQEVKGIYFKGGTALQKIFLNYSRLSEDADFSITRNLKEIVEEITIILEESKFFSKITKDKDVDGFTRLVVHYKELSYEGTVFIDLNERSKLLLKPEIHKINHFYSENIPEFKMYTIAKEEMVAEKLAAAIGRNKPRDHFDIYKILEAKIPISLELAKKKCKQSGVEFNIIKMFNNANKLKTRWDQDLIPLLSEEVSFQDVMKVLAKHFKLKEEKDKKKNGKF